MTTAEWISVGVNVVMAVAAVVTMVVAVLALRTWKDQRNHDLVRRLLLEVYTIDAASNHLFYLAKHRKIYRDLFDAGHDRDNLPQELNKFWNDVQKLRTSCFEAEVVLGPDAVAEVEAYRRSVAMLSRNLSVYLFPGDLKPPDEEEMFQQLDSQLAEFAKDWNWQDPEQRVRAIAERLRSYLKP